MRGAIFWKTREIGLPSYSKYSLYGTVYTHKRDPELSSGLCVYQLIEGGRWMLCSDYYCICETLGLVSSVYTVATRPLQKLEAQKRFSLVSTKEDL
jgi:hypothetical protein